MLIIEALKTLSEKVTGSRSNATSIAAVINDMAISFKLPAASKDTAGGVKQAALVQDAVGDNPTKEEYNALLAALKAAGIMASE